MSNNINKYYLINYLAFGLRPGSLDKNPKINSEMKNITKV